MSRLPSRIFMNGNSQAVRIPQAFRLDVTEVEISRAGNGDLVLHPIHAARADRADRGSQLAALLAEFNDDEFIAALETDRTAAAPMQERAFP